MSAQPILICRPTTKIRRNYTFLGTTRSGDKTEANYGWLVPWQMFDLGLVGPSVLHLAITQKSLAHNHTENSGTQNPLMALRRHQYQLLK
jgi:hypothetical protein